MRAQTLISLQYKS